jgi:hypothetical protein
LFQNFDIGNAPARLGQLIDHAYQAVPDALVDYRDIIYLILISYHISGEFEEAVADIVVG